MFKSLRAQLLLWVILLESVILIFAGAIQYNQKSMELFSDLHNQCQMVSTRLSGILPAAIYSFDEDQVSRVLMAEMENKNISQLLVGANGKVSGFGRDKDWKAIPVDKKSEVQPEISTKLIYVKGKNQEELGELQVFEDKKFVNEALKSELKHTIILILILDLSILILLSIILRKKILLPMQNIAETMKQVSLTRNASIRLTTRGASEIQEVVESTNAMLEANQQAAMVAEKLGNGDLSIEVIPVSDEDTMGHAQKQMLAKLTGLLTQISNVSSSLIEGAEILADASHSLSSQTTSEAASVEEISSSLVEIANRAKSNAENSELVRVLSNNAKESAANGNSQMHLMVESINEISRASGQIAKVIKVIDDIAFQTNLLALNAAVESARAGKHGKGFAVVADEVRNLAGKSAKAAKETSDLIESTISKIKSGTEIAAQTNEVLQTIVKAVEKTTGLIEEIAQASQEQALGVSQITSGISTIEATTQKNCATSEETSSAAENLNALAKDLYELITHFNLGKADQETQSHASSGKNVKKKSGTNPGLKNKEANKSITSFERK